MLGGFFVPLPSAATGEMNITSCLTNIQGHTHSVFDSQDNRAEKQKQEAWASANIKLNNNKKKNPLICRRKKKIMQSFCYFRVRQYRHYVMKFTAIKWDHHVSSIFGVELLLLGIIWHLCTKMCDFKQLRLNERRCIPSKKH